MLTHVLQRQLGSNLLQGCGNRCSSAEELQFEDAMRGVEPMPRTCQGKVLGNDRASRLCLIDVKKITQETYIVASHVAGFSVKYYKYLIVCTVFST